MRRARAAQAEYARWPQERVDEAALACGWAIMKPENNRALAEIAVRDSGLGNVEDKFAKNHRKTLGLLRDIARREDGRRDRRGPGSRASPRSRARWAWWRRSRPPPIRAATPANQIINALKCGNAVILAPSPKGSSDRANCCWSSCTRNSKRSGAPLDLVQMLPAPVTKESTHELMRQADLVAATGSQSNIRAAYSSGTPAIGVGMGNVVSIVDASADLADAARKIALSKTFDNATSCSSENAVVILGAGLRRE